MPSLAFALLAVGLAEVKPAWPGVFPDLGVMYSASYAKPIVGKGPRAYSQQATYTWTGGRIEEITVTLARDPAFKKQYDAKEIKRAKPPPQARTINKKAAWAWVKSEAGEERVVRLVVVLDNDKIIQLEQKGEGAALVDVAKKFDFAKVAKALGQGPK